MALYPYKATLTFDVEKRQFAANSVGQVYALEDINYTTPLAPVDASGLPVVLRSSSDYILPTFYLDRPSVNWKSGEYVFPLVTSVPLKGDKGDQGDTGPLAELAIGTVETVAGTATDAEVIADQIGTAGTAANVALRAAVDAQIMTPGTPANTAVSASIAGARRLNTIVWAGDSNTDNGGGPGRHPSTRPGSFWPYANIMLGHRLKTLRNAGVGGDTSTQLLARFDAEVVALSPAWVHILIGTNDAGVDTVAVPLETTKANILAMLNKCRSINARIIVGTIPPRDARTGASSVHALTLNAWIRELTFTQPDVIVVDYFSVLADPATPDKWVAAYQVSSDGTHFNGKGGSVAGKLLADTLRPLVPAANRVSRVITDPTNLIGAQSRFDGAAAGVGPSGWFTSQAAMVQGLFDRPDGIPGKVMRVIVPNGGTFSLIRNGDAAVNVGETAIFALEFWASSMEELPASQFITAKIAVQTDGGGTTPSELGNVSGASGDTRHGNLTRSGVLETPPYARKSTDTAFKAFIQIAGGGTYDLACATLTKVTP